MAQMIIAIETADMVFFLHDLSYVCLHSWRSVGKSAYISENPLGELNSRTR
jgi:hypothetical protein